MEKNMEIMVSLGMIEGPLEGSLPSFLANQRSRGNASYHASLGLHVEQPKRLCGGGMRWFPRSPRHVIDELACGIRRMHAVPL